MGRFKGGRVIEPGWILYHSDDSEASLTEAREYISDHGLTAEDVRLIRKDNAIMVVAKRRIWDE